MAKAHLLALFVMFSCTKQTTSVAPALDYSGWYDVTMTANYSEYPGGTVYATEIGIGSVKITREVAANTYTVVEELPSYSQRYAIVVDDDEYELQPITDRVRVSNIDVSGTQRGRGKFDKKGFVTYKSTGVRGVGISVLKFVTLIGYKR